jgi:hypothetical protein
VLAWPASRGFPEFGIISVRSVVCSTTKSPKFLYGQHHSLSSVMASASFMSREHMVIVGPMVIFLALNVGPVVSRKIFRKEYDRKHQNSDNHTASHLGNRPHDQRLDCSGSIGRQSPMTAVLDQAIDICTFFSQW